METTQQIHETQWGRTLAITGVLLQLAPMIGLLAAVLGLASAFNLLGTTPTGVSDPEQVASHIGSGLVTVMIGTGIGILGLISMSVALVGSRYRAEWFFWFLMIYSAIILFGFPLGIPFAIFFLVYCLTRRSEFLSSTPAIRP